MGGWKTFWDATPQKYWKRCSEVGAIRKFGTDWSLVNIEEASGCLKIVAGISSSKRIFIKQGKTSGIVM